MSGIQMLFFRNFNGYDENWENCLNPEAHYDYVVFTGNIPGGLGFDMVSYYFNRVFKPIKKYLRYHPNSQPQELLCLLIGEFPVKDYLENLVSFIKEHFSLDVLDGKAQNDILALADYAAKIGGYSCYGEFITKLVPEEMFEHLKSKTKKNIRKSVQLMKEFARRGSTVIIVDADWSACKPFDFDVSKNFQPIPSSDRGIKLKNFMPHNYSKIHYYDQAGILENEKDIFQILPSEALKTLGLFGMDILFPDLPKIQQTESGKRVFTISNTPEEMDAMYGCKVLSAKDVPLVWDIQID